MLYSRITEFSSTMCCGEWKAVCPDCGSDICVFCEGECSSCASPIF